MEHGIPSLEKKLIAAAFVFIALQIGLIAYAVVRLGIAVPTCVTNVQPFSEGKFIEYSPTRYEVHVLARMWEFEPDHIKIPKGSVVDFYLTSKDVTHGFYIGRTNVNLMALPNVVNYAQARFDRPGVYPILCHEYCGAGHVMMHAEIEVTDSNEPGSAEGLPDPAAASAP